MFGHFKILRRKHYAPYFFGQLVSASGSWMQGMVQGWLVYKLTHSTAWLGAIAFFLQVPAFCLSPVAGVVADHADRRKILMVVQLVGMIQATALAILVYTHSIQLWHIALLAALLGVITAFDITARHAFSVDMVGKEDLRSAIALNSVIVNVSRIVGPALGGLLIGVVGEGSCFALNALSYIGVIYSLLQMKVTNRTQSEISEIVRPLRESILYVKGNPEILWLLGIACFVGFFGAPYNVMLPAIAKDVLKGDEGTLAWLTTFNSLGALMQVFITSDFSSVEVPKQKLMRRILFLSIALVILGMSQTKWISCLALIAAGYFMTGTFPMINNSIQHLVSDKLRGRVLSLYTMTFLGAMPLGGVLGGIFAENFGTGAVIIGCGFFCAVGGFFLIRNEPVSR